MDNARYDGRPNIAQRRNQRYATAPPFLNFNHLRDLFKPDMFYAKRVWLLPNSDASFPWYSWRSNNTPKWWTAYNRLKHNRFDNVSKASYLTVMHAMKGTFLALVQSPEYRTRLVERGIIRSPRLSHAALITAANTWEPLNTAETVFAKSDLIGYKFLTTGSPGQANDTTVFLQ